MRSMYVAESKPMFRAFEDILNGIPVIRLDKILKECGENYAEKHGFCDTPYLLAMVVLTAYAENRILMGDSPTDAYKSTFQTSNLIRDDLRGGLEIAVQTYKSLVK